MVVTPIAEGLRLDAHLPDVGRSVRSIRRFRPERPLTGTGTFGVFPAGVLRPGRGDQAGRARSQAFGSSLGIPDDQLERPV